MERIPVESGMIKSVGFDPATETLEVELAKGAVYRYADVNAAEYAAFLNAESKGKHFLKTIKPNRACTKIPPAEQPEASATA